jgi:hypothetical protein
MQKVTQKIEVELSAQELELLVALVRTEKMKIVRSGKAPNPETRFLFAEMSKLYTRLNNIRLSAAKLSE